ncbi:MAG: peptidoglycan-binding protein [Acidobacteria bacterium]|nr:peptidoglycan-binding protein [Acidobacteriota bacterium]
MKKLLFLIALSLTCGVSLNAQSTTTPPAPSASPRPASTITVAEAKNTKSPTAAAPAKKRGPVFRPTKDQIKQVQAMLKEKSLYKGEATGSYNDETRSAIKSFQKDNGLKQTGTLNRATLEKMNIELTENQKAIPVSESSFADADEEKKPAKEEKAASSEPKPKKAPIFRATGDQIKEAQKMLKAGSMYSGEQTGKLDDATRDGLKKYQEANGIKVTGTLNRVTLEKMGIALTEKQKADGEGQ